MEQYNNVLKADENKYLTNGKGVYAREVTLGKGDSADNWMEITGAQKAAFEKEDEERMEREMNAAMGNV